MTTPTRSQPIARFSGIPARHPGTLSRLGEGVAGVAWPVYAVIGALLLAYLGVLMARSSSDLIDGWGVVAINAVSSGLCIASAFRRRSSRAVPLTLGASLFSWTLGDTALTIESAGGATPPVPSVADGFYLGFFALAYVALVLYLRGEVRRLATPNWLDGAVAALGAAALCSAFAFHEITHLTREGAAATAVNLAYPVGDLLLLTLVVGGTTLLSGRSKGPWLLLGFGMAINVAGDTFNLFGATIGSSHAGTVVNSIAWPTAIWLMSMSMWLPRHHSDPLAVEQPTGFLLPGLASACGMVVLLAGAVQAVNGVAIGLAAATLALVCLRTAISVRALRTLTEERQRLSITDQLTGLGNRRHLFNVLDAFFAEEAAGAGRPRRLAFLFIDLEHFKEINDSFGHPAGDEILKQVGARLSRALEADDVVTRIGGDEFAVLLLDAGPEQAATVAARISEALREPFRLDAVHAQLGASIGIAIAPDDACDGATLMWCADVAMYRAKFGSTPHARYQRDTGDTDDHLRLAEELRAAVDAGELIVHYQPQLNLKTGTIGSVEALVRWPHPSLGLIPPLDFLGLAEDAGFMPRVTELVLAKALAQGAAWQRAGCEISVSVNIAASDLLRPGLAVTTAELLKQHGLAAERLVLEITETGIITDFERGKQVVGELQEMGVAVSIDDFGAGFTSLAYLSGLAVSELKLDRALIAQLAAGHTRRDLQLVRATVELGHALGLRVVAEGIDSQQTLDLVTELGCDMAQGYFIGTPKPANKLSFRQAAEANGHPAARSAPKRLLPSA